MIRPGETGEIERLVDFALNELSDLPVSTHALPLVTFLVYSNSQAAKSCQKEASDRIREYERACKKEAKLRRQVEKFEHLLSYVIWPNAVKLSSAAEMSTARRQRDVSPDGDGNSGFFFSERMNRTVQYESLLEFSFLLQLEQFEDVVFYQEQPFEVPYEYGGKTRIYYPDLLFVLSDGRGVVVEIKPVFKMALRENLVKWSALRGFCREKGLGILITDGRYSIQQVQRRNVDPGFAKAVLAALQHGPLSWQEYKKIRDRYDVTQNDFSALVLHNRLIWELSPFTLSHTLYRRRNTT